VPYLPPHYHHQQLLKGQLQLLQGAVLGRA
jgi:hypothetical protein